MGERLLPLTQNTNRYREMPVIAGTKHEARLKKEEKEDIDKRYLASDCAAAAAAAYLNALRR
jgi:hypothetical protein